jgi:hypothetical protein
VGPRPHPRNAAAEADRRRGGGGAGHPRRHHDPRAARQAPRAPECATCHVKIDPPGFALENFDVIGGWRENYRSVGKGDAISGKRYKKGPAIDAGDVTPDGRRFKDIDEYKEILLKDKDLLARALAEKLMTYGRAARQRRSTSPRSTRSSARCARRNTGSARWCTRSCRAGFSSPSRGSAMMLNRRHFLRAATGSLVLPWLDAFAVPDPSSSRSSG